MKYAATLATVAVVAVPLLRAACADSGASEASLAAAGATPVQARGDSGSIRELIDGIRGANAVQCELLLQAFAGWTTTVPDKDPQAWSVTQRVRQRVTGAADIAWLGAQMRSGDTCAARASARLLGRSPSPAARTVLVNALSDTSAPVRRLGAVGIGIRSDSTANRRLVAMLGDRDPGVRAAAAWALGAVH